MSDSRKGFPDRAERLEAATSKTFAQTNRIWNDGYFNSIARVGRVFDLVKRANHEYLSGADYSLCGPVMPPSYWESYYFSQVKTEKEIFQLAEEFRERCAGEKVNLSPRQAFCFVLCRVIDQTYDGLVNEMLAFLLLQASHPDIELSVSGDRYDRQYGVDFIGKQRGQVVKAFQQKPEWFYAAVERYCQQGVPDWVRTSANAHYKANLAFEKDFSVPVEYISLHREETGSIELVNHGPFIAEMAEKNRSRLKPAAG